jgi:hypothetical protein
MELLGFENYEDLKDAHYKWVDSAKQTDNRGKENKWTQSIAVGSTMIYLKLDLRTKRAAQKKFIEYSQSTLKHDPKIDELIDWEHKKETLAWLDSL